MSLLSTVSAVFLCLIAIVVNTGLQVEAGTGIELYDACDRGDLAEVRRLLGPNCTDVNEWMGPNGQTPLLAAAEKNHTRVAMLLLSCDADPNRDTEHYPYPIIHAAQHGAEGVVRVLLGAGAQATINTQSYAPRPGLRGWTPIMMASKFGHVKIVKALISAESNLDLKREDCYTALMEASEHGYLDLVKELISAGAAVDQSCWPLGLGSTALILASRGGYLDVVNALISAGANVDAEQKDGYTALMLASIDGHLEVVMALISAGAEVNQHNGNTEEGTEFYGTNNAIQKYAGETALHIAAEKNRTEVVKTLLKHGADTKIKTNAGNTAEDIARENGFTDILKLIQQYSVCMNLYQ